MNALQNQNKRGSLAPAIKHSENLLPAEYKPMLDFVSENLPAVHESTKNFMKRNTQFMDNMLTTSKLTPLRNAHQILAQIRKTEEAIKHNQVKAHARESELALLLEEIQHESNPHKKDLLKAKAVEAQIYIEGVAAYMAGAVRKVANHVAQYNAVLKAAGKENFTEADVEAEEETYQIMTAFSQALMAARAKGGIIDEGNHIFFMDIGINGGAAQAEITAYLVAEREKIKASNGKSLPTHQETLLWLTRMATKYKGCSLEYAKWKGMDLAAGAVALRPTTAAGDLGGNEQAS